MSLKKLIQQEKQHISVAPTSYFILIFLSLTGVFTSIIELSLMFVEDATFIALQVSIVASLIVTAGVFILLFQANNDLLEEEIVEQDSQVNQS
ncbi:hypothetical protein [Thalassotalea sp. PS06]|uniref:hypothetical protein n=1 Tax=Thalassotalea sp. PS06 TaxID=2594005 RepID=UPI0011634782|nr:hypothetical protein [Thalassotalea sp. PS06]QDP00568.1 hypothetical protein FNC98_03885 [Thalassotalea sp. PS06]